MMPGERPPFPSLPERAALRQLLKLTVILGMVEKEHSYYWRLLFWSMVNRPRLLPPAFTLTAYGFHFRKCFEQHLRAGH